MQAADHHIGKQMPVKMVDLMAEGTRQKVAAAVFNLFPLAVQSANRHRTRAAGDTPGLVVDVDSVGTGSFTVLCGTGALVVTSVKPEGKGVMSAGDFIRGRKIAKGDILN